MRMGWQHLLPYHEIKGTGQYRYSIVQLTMLSSVPLKSKICNDVSLVMESGRRVKRFPDKHNAVSLEASGSRLGRMRFAKGLI